MSNSSFNLLRTTFLILGVFLLKYKTTLIGYILSTKHAVIFLSDRKQVSVYKKEHVFTYTVSPASLSCTLLLLT